jgi:hypothetical protein
MRRSVCRYRFYTEMASEQNDAKFGDSDAVTYCAFSFPAVLQTVGRTRWADELSQTYFLLVKDLQWKVRRTLAHSLHEVARTPLQLSLLSLSSSIRSRLFSIRI